MNKQTTLLLVVALAMIGAGAGLLRYYQAHQKLGLPGVKTRPIPQDSHRLQVVLPEQVLNYLSESVPMDELASNALPADTSYGQRLYTAPDGFKALVNVVLMGIDRTSLHKPQFCLEGQGWHIDAKDSLETTIPVKNPWAYELPVVKLVATRDNPAGGQSPVARGIYVYWYIADGALSASTSGFQRMWWMAKDLFRTGVLQRWAYVTCFAVCSPGQEDATFERMKTFITECVPQLQLYAPKPPDSIAKSGP